MTVLFSVATVILVLIVTLVVWIVWDVLRKKGLEVDWNNSDLRGKIVIVTGGNTGMGRVTIEALAGMKAESVVLGCRKEVKNEPSVSETIQEIKNKSQNQNVKWLELDLSSIESVESFVKQFWSSTSSQLLQSKEIILILNAGVSTPFYRQTKEGAELTVGVNYIGHCFLALLFTHYFIQSSPSSNPSHLRIIIISSQSQHMAPNYTSQKDSSSLFQGKPFSGQAAMQGMNNYYISKLYIQMFSVEFNDRIQQYLKTNNNNNSNNNKKVTINSLDPGATNTQIARETPAYMYWPVKLIMKCFFKTPLQGAQTAIALASNPTYSALNGQYFYMSELGKIAPSAQSQHSRKELWDDTMRFFQINNKKECYTNINFLN